MIGDLESYGRSDDYDPEGAEWASFSVMGSAFEEEMDIRSSPARWRHRHYFERGPWGQGRAPQ